jgi:dihydroorotate dehydrogenase
MDPERVHALTLRLLRVVGQLPPLGAIVRSLYSVPEKPVQVFGLTFSNPVGLAAGYDKDGTAWRGLASLGFGHIEVGTVTPRPQSGNQLPRLFRLPEDRALINRMGFPGRGAESVARQFQYEQKKDLVLGVNLGMNKDTPLIDAVDDYLALLHIFAPLADYVVLNVSSPNTVGLRRLQAKDTLHQLLTAMDKERRRSLSPDSGPTPMLVKLAPDLTDSELDDALEVITDIGLDGVVATNTTISRDGLTGTRGDETGGVSGAPLRARSTEMIGRIYQQTGGKLPIIGVGGIMDADGAREKLDAGASLVQVYTGLVYRGPNLVREIVGEL